ncbi:MAG: peptide chain release factor N(5)-glutamine methyltransferase [Nitrosomonadales bacterium]|nr:peptide chain release factor N(5)-glutamine methyltransferase [Nitrosomonadales bacterium]
MRSIGQILSEDAVRLGQVLSLERSTARIEVQALLQHILQCPRSFLLSHPEQMLSADQQAAYVALFERRLRGEPIAYLLGEREFFGLTFKVTPAALIPRPDTELLVETALEKLPAGAEGVSLRILDMGTGSGAIALSIAHARPDAEVVALDASPAALAVARENTERLGLANVNFMLSDWFAALAGMRFQLIVSNPPYVAAGDPHLADLSFEPMSALASGADGLDDIRRILAEAQNHLHPGGWLLLEHGYDQAGEIRKMLCGAGFEAVFSACDLAGIERISGGHA